MLPPLQILVAEDSPAIQKLIGLLLRRFGQTPVIVDNGLAAVEIALGQKFELILMDLQLPLLSGIEAAQQITEKLPAGERPKIVALTANTSATTTAECEAVGMNGFLEKPLNPDKLEQMLAAVAAERTD